MIPRVQRYSRRYLDLLLVAMTCAGVSAMADAQAVELAPGVEIEVVSLTRVGNAVELKYSVTNNVDSDYLMLQNGFGKEADNRNALSVIELLDLVNAKRYAVGRAEDRCLCSDQSLYEAKLLTVPAGQSKVFWALFAAPPLDLPTISVQFPGIPPVHGIPIGS